MEIYKSKTYETNSIEVEVYDLSEAEKLEYIDLDPNFQPLQHHPKIIAIHITSKGKQTQILIPPERVVPCIEEVTSHLISKDEYEVCAVLRDVKEEYLKHDN